MSPGARTTRPFTQPAAGNASTSPPGQWAIVPGPSVRPVEPAVTAPASRTSRSVPASLVIVITAAARNHARPSATRRGRSGSHARRSNVSGCSLDTISTRAPRARISPSSGAWSRPSTVQSTTRSAAASRGDHRRGCRRSPATHRSTGWARDERSPASARRRRTRVRRATARRAGPSRRARAGCRVSLSTATTSPARSAHRSRCADEGGDVAPLRHVAATDARWAVRRSLTAFGASTLSRWPATSTTSSRAPGIALASASAYASGVSASSRPTRHERGRGDRREQRPAVVGHEAVDRASQPGTADAGHRGALAGQRGRGDARSGDRPQHGVGEVGRLATGIERSDAGGPPRVGRGPVEAEARARRQQRQRANPGRVPRRRRTGRSCRRTRCRRGRSRAAPSSSARPTTASASAANVTGPSRGGDSP